MTCHVVPDARSAIGQRRHAHQALRARLEGQP